MSTWALVLAAGEGSRLRSLTTTHTGVSVPKQFCSLLGGHSLLQEAMHRAEAIARRQRICVVVADQHRRWWEGPLWSLPTDNIVVQPENRGTANGILLPLLQIVARDPDAHVVLLPSDHHIRDEASFARSLRQAAALVSTHADQILMLGVTPDEVDPELGYIVPDRSDRRGALRVSKFIEKPAASVARELIDGGALWNVFILAGKVKTFLRLYEARYPALMGEMSKVAELDLHDAFHSMLAADLYQHLPELDFSRHIVEGQENNFRVVPVSARGWSDLGTPQRVADTLRRIPGDSIGPRNAMAGNAFLNLSAQHARMQYAG